MTNVLLEIISKIIMHRHMTYLCYSLSMIKVNMHIHMILSKLLYQMMKNNTTGFFLAFCFELLVIQIIPEIKSIDEMSGMYFVVLL